MSELDGELRSLYGAGYLASELGRELKDGDEMLENVIIAVKEKLEAYISKHYIKKEDVLELLNYEIVGEIKGRNAQLRGDGRNQMRAEIKSKLNSGDK